jgi:hypothetical protein
LPKTASTDTAYLGSYVVNQGSQTPADLALLPAGNAGVPITSDLFMAELLALQAFLLYEFLNVPPSMLWQTVIALDILSNYGLFTPDLSFAPTDLFSYDKASLASDVTTPNPSLANETAYLYADTLASSRSTRPFLVCNMGMLLNETGTDLKYLAAVQATPFFTGILGSPQGTDANGQQPGGGGITSFAFNSIFVKSNQDGTDTVTQTRQWALTDIVGTSSAFFAEVLQNQIAYWEKNPLDFIRLLAEYLDEILKWIKSHLPLQAQAPAAGFVKKHAAAKSAEDVAVLQFKFPNLQDIIPEYYYFPVGQQTPVNRPQPTRFADGGSLDNTGVNGLLAYSDIQSIIAFINTEEALQQGQYGISDGNGGFVPNTNIIVDESIPPLFGYQPYDATNGYVLYSGAQNESFYYQYMNNQVFDSSEFANFLTQLWSNTGASNNNPAVLSQTLVVRPNTWFGIQGGQTVTVVWNYLSYVTQWDNLFSNNSDVQNIIANEVSTNNFPHYSTLTRTQLNATQVNLLSNLTSWCVVQADQQTEVFSKLFTTSGSASKAAKIS